MKKHPMKNHPMKKPSNKKKEPKQRNKKNKTTKETDQGKRETFGEPQGKGPNRFRCLFQNNKKMKGALQGSFGEPQGSRREPWGNLRELTPQGSHKASKASHRLHKASLQKASPRIPKDSLQGYIANYSTYLRFKMAGKIGHPYSRRSPSSRLASYF